MFTISNKFILTIAIFISFFEITHAQDVFFDPISTNLDNPTSIANAGDGSERLFITEQDGRILIFDGSRVLSTPFIDIGTKVGDGGSEQGLLGLAFHPDYESNGLFYVNYTDDSGDTVVERYTVTSNPNIADPNSGQTVIAYDQPASNHNGGYLAFGPDSLLYISSGDGGGSPGNRAQETTNLLGKILRLDVNGDDFPVDQAANYSIPVSNPFNNEIWVFGLRNPWRFSFDEYGNMFIGDVGERTIEEISFLPSSSPGGENYGWHCFEGSNSFGQCSPPINHTLPIIEYNHNPGGNCSVTGGFRYRGFDLPELVGDYIFADFCSGRVWNATEVSEGNWSFNILLETQLAISSFGEDESGEIYIVENPFSRNGGMFRLVRVSSGGTSTSSSGCAIAGKTTDKSSLIIFVFIFAMIIFRRIK